MPDAVPRAVDWEREYTRLARGPPLLLGDRGPNGGLGSVPLDGERPLNVGHLRRAPDRSTTVRTAVTNVRWSMGLCERPAYRALQVSRWIGA